MSGQFYAAAKNVGKTGAEGARRPCSSWPSGWKNRPRAWWCRPRCSRNSASTTSARSTGTTSIRSCPRWRTSATCWTTATARSSCTWSPKRARATSWPRPTRWPTTAPASSTRRSAWQARHAAQAHLHPGVRPVAVRHGRAACGWWASPPPCAKARAWSSSTSAFPGRYFDVGIAEQHAVTFAAGLACEGMKPVVAIYSTFLQRAYDQLIHDVALQNLPVVFALDRAGLVGADGATHAGAYDIAYLRCIPNMSIACPADEAECHQLLSTPSSRTTRWRCATRAAPAWVRPLPTGLEGLALRQGRVRRQRAGRGHPGLRHPAVPGAAGGRGAQCQRGQHALGQAAGPGAAARTGAQSPGAGDGGGGLRDGGCRLRRARGFAGRRPGAAGAALGCPTFIEHGDPARLLSDVGLDAVGIERSIRMRFSDLLHPGSGLKAVA
jgi:hypothetical protein